MNSDIPGPSRILQTAMKKKVNAEKKARCIWSDINKTKDDTLNPNVFSLPEKLLKHSMKMKSSPGGRPKAAGSLDSKSIY